MAVMHRSGQRRSNHKSRLGHQCVRRIIHSWQDDREPAAVPRLAVDLDRTSLTLDQLTRDQQSESESMRSDIQVASAAPQAAEEIRQILGGDTRSGVTYHQYYPGAL